MWTDKERAIARALLEPDYMAFLKKVFVDLKAANGNDLDKNIASLDNERYGELMKVVYLASQENKSRLNLIRQAAQPPKKAGSAATAPR